MVFVFEGFHCSYIVQNRFTAWDSKAQAQCIVCALPCPTSQLQSKNLTFMIIYYDTINTDPLVQDTSYGGAVTFYDEGIIEEVTSEGSSIDFENGVEVKVPEGVIPPYESISFKAQPAFASTDVFKLPDNVQAASPTYLLSSDSQLNGSVALTMEHFVEVRTQDDANSLVFLLAQSAPSMDSTYHFRQVHSGHPEFKRKEMVGTISMDQFGFWKVGKKCVGTYCSITLTIILLVQLTVTCINRISVVKVSKESPKLSQYIT